MSSAAIGRSLRLYHAPERRPALDEFHRRFLGPGELAFDIGCHVGDRAASFLRLGAVVVAVEPQPRLARALRLMFSREPRFTLVPALIGASEGEAVLRLNSANPTVATASEAFIAAAADAPGWEGQVWDAEIPLPRTTLDALIARYGRPDFVKIDVEGWEAEVLAGLSAAPRALSFEFTTIQRGVALDCLDRLTALGYEAFNACLGESMAWAFPSAVTVDVIADWLRALPVEANSGDVYAALEPGRLTA
ncbi:MAG: FkbM family methyltransferase [Rubritepida sp.]|nr:FkbM family methyltransferase [Rubritepida sp.]